MDRKSTAGLSFSTVDHLRWDLKQIFGMAVAEDYLQKNPTALLFTPSDAKRPAQRVMTWQEVRLLFSVLKAIRSLGQQVSGLSLLGATDNLI